MKKRTARRKALARHDRWIVRRRYTQVVPRCILREYHRIRTQQFNKFLKEVMKDMPYFGMTEDSNERVQRELP